MDDIGEFFAEQDRRMGLPDEDVDEYIRARLEAAAQKMRVAQGCDTGSHPQGTGVRSAGMQAQHRLDHGSTVASFRSPQRHREARIITDSKLDDVRSGFSETRSGDSELGPPSEGVRCITPEVSHSGTHSVKRRKTTHVHSGSNPADFPLPSIPKDLVPDSNTSRQTQSSNRSLLADLSLVLSSTNTVTVRLSPQHSRTRDNVSGSADPALLEDRDPTIWPGQSQISQMPGVAMLAAQGPRSSDLDGTHRNASKVCQTPQGQDFDTLPTLADARASVFDMSSLSPLCNVPSFSSTAFDGHTRDVLEILERSHIAHISPLVIEQSAPLRSSSSPVNDAHEASSAEDYPIPRTPAGFPTEAHPDASNITSPGYTPRPPSAIAATSVLVSDARRSVVDTKGPKQRKIVDSTRKPRKPSTIIRNKKAKEKPKLVTPLEYAQKLQSGLDLFAQNKSTHLRGKRIFYIGGDMLYASDRTRGCMEYIVKHGGTLVAKYDPAVVTHIVTDTTVRPTLRALSLKSLSEIPDHIPTVKWSWVISDYGKMKKGSGSNDVKGKGKAVENDDRGEDDSMNFEFLHAAFPERINAGRNQQHSRQSGMGGCDQGGSANDISADISQISAFSQETKAAEAKARGSSSLTVLPPPPLDLRPSSGHEGAEHVPSNAQGKLSTKEDPLAEYYAQARAEHEAQWNRDALDSDDGEDVEDIEDHPVVVPRRGFACDMKGRQVRGCVNQHIIDKLEELRELHNAKPSEDDRWRAYSYGKCIPSLRNYPKPIKSFSEARAIRGVGEKTALKIMEIINTGDLKRIKYENTEDVESTRMFQGIYGVGRQTAFSWFASGLRTLDDIRARKGGLKLSAVQEIGLKYYEDINTRMPREEARRIFEMIKPIALAIDDRLFVEITGSYRRGKADCGDIDILITRPTEDGNTHQGVLLTLLGRLHTAGILTEDLAIPEDFSDLELVYRGLCKLPELPDAKRRRIDFLCVPWESRGAALLYYTGDDIFNRSMRLKANKHGYSLNQRGLYAGVVRDSHDRQKKTCEGTIIASETEAEIFEILGVPWQEPHVRVRS